MAHDKEKDPKHAEICEICEEKKTTVEEGLLVCFKCHRKYMRHQYPDLNGTGKKDD